MITINEVRQVVCKDWHRRSEILEPEVNLFCWKRALEVATNRYLEKLLTTEFTAIRCLVDQQNLQHQLERVSASWGEERAIGHDSFWKDVYRLTSDFLHFSKDGTGILHLRIIDHNACSKFHTDGYHLRLLTTYLGPGTEWLTEDNVNRDALGTRNEKIVKHSSSVKQMKAGDVGILKGDLFKHTGTANGIVHRSPAIAGTGEERIILRVDI